MTSHAAVVARGLGVCCGGVRGIKCRCILKQARCGELLIEEGDVLSVTAALANYQGQLPDQCPGAGLAGSALTWAAGRSKGLRKCGNKMTLLLAFEAAGIGLARTEHMFLGKSVCGKCGKSFWQKRRRND